MNKADLIASIAQREGISKVAAAAALKGVVSALTEALSSGNEISITGFGSFSIKQRIARKGRHPVSRELIIIPARKIPVFKSCKALKLKIT